MRVARETPPIVSAVRAEGDLKLELGEGSRVLGMAGRSQHITHHRPGVT